MMADAVAAETKLLSICMFGRDDDYTPDFKYRLATTLNYIARNVSQLNRQHEIEILITDWGSAQPLAKSLELTPDAGAMCRFIYVPPELVRSLQNGRADFHLPLAANAVLRRARGEFIMIGACDTLMTRPALNTVVQLMEHKIDLPVQVNGTLFLCPRYHIPWQFFESRPDLDAIDRYLLLSANELNYDLGTQLPICAGAGALLMHRRLWHELRGLDERFDGWGFTDTDLSLRLSQLYPWMGLSSLGVSVYHMEHRPGGRRAVAIQNPIPMDHNVAVQVNHDDWGLATHQLEEQIPVAPSQHTEPRKSLKSIAEVVAELSTPPIAGAIMRGANVFPRDPAFPDDLEALVFLAWHSLNLFPSQYVEFGIRRGYAAAIVLAASPAAELFGLDEWSGVAEGDSDIAHVFSRLRGQVGYRAYARLINGPLETAITRLEESLSGAFAPGLAFVRGDRLGAHLGQQVAQLIRRLAPGGAIVVNTARAGELEQRWTEWAKLDTRCVFFLSGSGKTGMILREGVEAAGIGNTAPILCNLEVAPVYQRITAQAAPLFWKALSQPQRFPEFAARLFVRYARRKWPYNNECA